MFPSKNDPIEGDDEEMEGEAPAAPPELRAITRHPTTGRIVSNKAHTPLGMHGQNQPPRGKLHSSGSLIKPSGSGATHGMGKPFGAGVKPATAAPPAGGSSKPGAMGPAKDGRAKIAKIIGGMK